MSRPEIIEIEPVERCRATIMLEPRHVSPHRAIEPRRAVARPGFRRFGQGFKKDIIRPVAAIDPNHHHDRPLQQHCHPKWTLRKRRRDAEKRVADEIFAADIAVGEQPDEMTTVQSLGDGDERVRPSKANHLRLELWIDRRERGADLARVFLVHHETDGQIALATADRPRHLEAAEMRAEQDAAAAAPLDVPYDLLAVDANVELIDLLVQQKHAIEHAGREGQEMTKHIGNARLAAENPREVLPRTARCFGRRREEIEASRVKKKPRHRPAQPQRHPDAEFDQRQGTTLGTNSPFLNQRILAHRRANPVARVPAAARASPSTSRHSNLMLPSTWRCHWTRTVSPGRTGRKNFAARMTTSASLLAATATAFRTSSSKRAPGMIGLDGKWPAAVG